MAADSGGNDGQNDGQNDDERDPFADLTLDEDFVRGASVTEQSAEARVHRIQRIRTEHDRIATDATAKRRSAVRSQRRERWRKRIVVVAVLAVLAGIGTWNYVRRTDSATATGIGFGFGGLDTGGSEFKLAGGQPPKGVEEADAPLGEPARVVEDSTAYRFMGTQAGSTDPVAFDPCRPIHLVVNSRSTVPGGDRMLSEAVAQVSNATGLRFVVDGETDEEPGENRAAYLPDRYPGRWAPVLVTWSTPAKSPQLKGDIAGFAGPRWVTTPKGSVSLSGTVTLDGPDFAKILAEPNGFTEGRAIIEHELGHLVGLDHVPDTTQLMDATNTGGVTTYQAGDLSGLAELGRGACFPDV